MPIWWTLLMHLIPRAFSFPLASDGKSIPARIAMMAMTTSNSMSVKARARVLPAWIMQGDCSETLACQAPARSTRRLGDVFALMEDDRSSLRKVISQDAFDFRRPMFVARVNLVRTDFVLVHVVAVS